MKDRIRAAVAAASIVCAGLTLTSCGRHDKRVAASRPAPRAELPSRPAEAPAPPRSSEAVWGLRSGLNVAALSCRGRGRQPVAGQYARMLARHRGLLATAYRREQGRQGAGPFDRQQTRVYNTFANQRSPARFCTAASSVAQRANRLDSAAFAVAAPRLLGELKAALRYRP